ncbi:Bug family tripartite tricarboxylate transporter substrate binding protein [Variovorax sp. M-6]|uniref:Bug family tripartite tricarboxylate transporter substrate binding protein n=1 Tax=Variovorax sp. M-6 TaxID=3233041 RepID=UPI003F9A5E3C
MKLTRLTRRRLASMLIGGASLASLVLPASAQTLSNRPIRLVVPYTTGGPADLATRILAEAITPVLGLPVIVENRPGATGKIAAEIVARAEPDGHTLLVGGTPQFVVLPMLDKSVTYKPFEDFRMISIFTNYEVIFMTGASSGVKSIKELASKMQDKNSDVTYASIGQAQLTPSGLAYLIFSKLVNGTAREVNYGGQVPGTMDLIAGRVTFGVYTLAGGLQHIQNGKVRALAVASPQRLPQLPDTPTMIEAGFPEFNAVNNWLPWIAVAAPGKTPDAIVNTINRAIVQVAQTDSFKSKIAQAGLTVKATGTAAQDQAEWRSESERLAVTLKRFDIRLPDEKK